MEFIAVNSDMQDLDRSEASKRVQIGQSITKGLGAGANPETGRQAMEEDRDHVSELLAGSDMVFVTAGMGGGTGTGAAPGVAEIARQTGALTVGIVTKPFKMEGAPRLRNAEMGIAQMKESVDTLIVIPNQRLLDICSNETTLREAFRMADDVLLQATRGISDLIAIPGEVNLDFSDVRTVMQQGGDALMGTGTAKGEGRANLAAEAAISSPLLEDLSIDGARCVLVNIAAGSDLKLFEVDESVSAVTKAVGHEANIIWGTVLDDALNDELRVTVIATGFTSETDLDETKARPVATDNPIGLDVPAYLRKADAAEVTEPQAAPEKNAEVAAVSLDDLEIPSFLRRRLKDTG